MPALDSLLIVTKRTPLEELIARFNSRAQAQFYIEHLGGSFDEYESQHARYEAALAALRKLLPRGVKQQIIERSFLPTFQFSGHELVITLGPDGLVVNTAKYLRGQPLVAVNPDPAHIDGVLLPFTVADAPAAVRGVLKNQATARLVTMAEARLNDGQSLLAFNDLFIGVRSHVSARYLIRAGDREEHHSSSGIIVSTGVGATGWLSSMFNMANGMLAQFASTEAPLERPRPAWDADQLMFVVREPFVSKTSGAAVVCGAVTPGAPLVIRSEMPDGGVIFSDGVEADFLAFNAGATATIGLAAQKARLVAG